MHGSVLSGSRRGLCNVCFSAHRSFGVTLFAAPRVGAAGKQGKLLQAAAADMEVIVRQAVGEMRETLAILRPEERSEGRTEDCTQDLRTRLESLVRRTVEREGLPTELRVAGHGRRTCASVPCCVAARSMSKARGAPGRASSSACRRGPDPRPAREEVATGPRRTATVRFSTLTKSEPVGGRGVSDG